MTGFAGASAASISRFSSLPKRRRAEVPHHAIIEAQRVAHERHQGPAHRQALRVDEHDAASLIRVLGNEVNSHRAAHSMADPHHIHVVEGRPVEPRSRPRACSGSCPSWTRRIGPAAHPTLSPHWTAQAPSLRRRLAGAQTSLESAGEAAALSGASALRRFGASALQQGRMNTAEWSGRTTGIGWIVMTPIAGNGDKFFCFKKVRFVEATDRQLEGPPQSAEWNTTSLSLALPLFHAGTHPSHPPPFSHTTAQSLILASLVLCACTADGVHARRTGGTAPPRGYDTS
eukprot:scaffold1097_cov246-Pinguiococcus_pyrenoidosus.AAC.7